MSCFGCTWKCCLLSILLVIVLFNTDGFWMCKSPFEISPIDLSAVEEIEGNTPPPSSSGYKENLELSSVEHLFEGQVSGPESLVFYGDHSIITSTADGKIVMLDTHTNQATTLYSRCDDLSTNDDKQDCVSRPLGIKLVDNHVIIFVDPFNGVFSIDLETHKQSQLFPPPANTGKQFDVMTSPYRLMNDLEVDEESVYFTHSSSLHHLTAFARSFLEGDCTGGIVRVDRKSLEYTHVLTHICFPNGLTRDTADPDFLLVSELSKARILRVNKNSGESTVFADGLPGFPDNIRSDDNGGYWIGFLGTRFSLLSQLLYDRPLVRLLLQQLNSLSIVNVVDAVLPPYGLVGYIDSSGRLTKLLHDPSGEGCQKISEASPHNGHLYIGSYHPDIQWVSRYRIK